MTMRTYLCDDGNAEVEIIADTAASAAQKYVSEGSWTTDKTSWVSVYVQEVDDDGEEIGEREWFKITIEPTEPECDGEHDHDWQSPHEVLGGLEVNPGVWGHGGGVKIKEVCAHCGHYRITDTWAQDRSDGEQGLESVEYESADYVSMQWVKNQAVEGGEV
jgi:hypothetical protein